MGYGSNHDTFSGCSLNLMEAYFNGDGNGLQCLSRGWDGNVVTNVDNGQNGNPSPTSAPTIGPPTITTAAIPISNGCLNVEMGMENYDGTWTAIEGGFDGHEAYSFVNPQGATKYLYYKELTWTTNTGSKWAISETLGSGTWVNLICNEQYLYECSSHWKVPGEDVITNSTTDYQCNSDGATQNSCDSRYSRICVAGSGPHGAYDGYYDASGCMNGQRFFNGSRGNFLCYDTEHLQWTITWSRTCERGSVVSQPTTVEAGVLDPVYWLYSSYGNSYHNLDDDLMVWDCSHHHNGALNLDDLSCLDDKLYDDEICMSTNHSLWSGDVHRTFKLYEELCANDEPIYHYVQYNDSKSLVLPSGEVLNAEVEATYYLHFEWVYLTVTDNETVGQWWLSKDEMVEHNRIAFCEQEDLMECTSNQWKVKVTSRDGTDGTIFHMLDDFSSVLDGHCDYHYDSQLDVDSDDSSTESSFSSGAVITGIVATLICLVLVGLVAFCVTHSGYQKYQNDALQMQQTTLDAEEESRAVKASPVDVDGDETTEISVDVDVDIDAYEV